MWLFVALITLVMVSSFHIWLARLKAGSRASSGG